MTMKKTMRWVACLLVLAMLPALGLAAESGETIYFDTPIECERMTIERVAFTRGEDVLLMEILYTLHDPLTAEDKEALELMMLNIMPDAQSTDFPEGFHAGSIGAVNESVGTAVIAGEAYVQEDTWDAWDSFPETIYLRPYYKLLGVWGEVIALHLADAKEA